MKRSVRISEGDIDGYNFFHRALIAAGWLEISQTRYIEFEFAKPDEIVITTPPPEPVPEPEPPPEPAEGPPAPWWESLPEPITPGEYASVFAARDPTPVYMSARADTPPQLADINRWKTIGYSFDAWHKPVRGSAWICVYDGALETPPVPDFVLWVNAGDVSEHWPPAP